MTRLVLEDFIEEPIEILGQPPLSRDLVDIVDRLDRRLHPNCIHDQKQLFPSILGYAIKSRKKLSQIANQRTFVLRQTEHSTQIRGKSLMPICACQISQFF